MGCYGEAAVKAAKMLRDGEEASPVHAWACAVRKVFPDSQSSQKKGCPRGSFLGLCEEGKVQGVAPGNYTKSEKNKQYALAAVELLEREPTLMNDPKLLWKKVLDGVVKAHNHQMTVVAALWSAELILR
jgi:hypothetical protein